MLATLALSLTLAATAPTAGLGDLRNDVEQAGARSAAARAERAAAQAELDGLAGRIEALKAGRADANVLARRELDGLLRRSQELSVRLNALLQAEHQAQEAAGAAQGRLSAELKSRVERLQARFEAAGSASERRALVEELRALRAERERLQPSAKAAAVPGLEARSDDPEELLERADALLDAEDKLRREEAALASRIRELAEERELERRMSDFMEESALFDDQDRRIAPNRSAARVQTERSESPAADAAPPPADVGAGAPSPGESGPSTSAPPTTPAPSTSAPEPAPVFRGEPGLSLGATGRLPDGFAAQTPPADASLEELQAHQARLRAQAAELHRAAQELSRRARQAP